MVDRHILIDHELATREAASVLQGNPERDRTIRIVADMTDDFGGAHLEQIDGVVAVDVGGVGHLQRGSDAARFASSRKRKREGIGGRLLAVRSRIPDDIEQRLQITWHVAFASRGLHFADRICASRIRHSIAGIVGRSIRRTIGAAVAAYRFIERQGRKVRSPFLRLDHRHQNARAVVEE